MQRTFCGVIYETKNLKGTNSGVSIQLQILWLIFFCLECNLVIEVDGGYHEEIEQKQYDAGRTYVLGEFKVKVIRFTNIEVIEQTDFVLNVIRDHLVNSTSSR